MQPLTLAAFRAIGEYQPAVADFLIWAGLFRTWYGVVNAFDPSSNVVSCIFEGTPRLLFTLVEAEMEDCTRLIRLSDIRAQRKGRWYACQVKDSHSVWYI